MNENVILVLGATGKTGRRVVARLRAAGHQVRAASRSGEVRFDWADRSTWRGALTGVSAVYLVAPEEPAPLHDFVQQAVAGGTGRFVALSGRGVDHFDAHYGQSMVDVEEAVRASGVAWSILRPNNFDQNFDEDLWHAPVMAGRLALPAGDAPEPFVDVEDVADVAAALLTRDGHAGRTYELSGPHALTFAAAAEAIANASGRQVRFVDLPPADYVAELVAQGVPDEAATSLAAMFGLLRQGTNAAPTDDVRRILGRAPRDFTTYATDAAAAGAWS